MFELQGCHEAYQILIKVIRAKNNFMKRAAVKREHKEKVEKEVQKVGLAWKGRSSAAEQAT